MNSLTPTARASSRLRGTRDCLQNTVLAIGFNPGGLVSYEPNFPNLFRRAAELTDRILRGTQPGDIPVEDCHPQGREGDRQKKAVSANELSGR
jgi:hypothetical protein